MKNLNTFILCLIFTFSASVQADTADCSGGRCPALDHVKDVGDKIAKDLVPFAVAAIVISVAGTVATERADGYVYTIDKNAYKNAAYISDNSIALPVGPHLGEGQIKFLISSLIEVLDENEYF